MKQQLSLVSIFSVMALAACNQSAQQKPEVQIAVDDGARQQIDCPRAGDAGDIDIAPGLSARIIKKGYGRAAVTGDYADTNVWLWQFDATADDRHGQFVWESGDDVFQFQLGRGQVIQGWDMGVPCMLEGETRELVVASDLAYGKAGRGAAIPPDTQLIFRIELLKLTTPQ